MMPRPLAWIIALSAIAMIGVMAWPTEHHSGLLTLLVALLVVAGFLVPSAFARAATVTLGVFTLTVIAEPALLVSKGGDPRIAWAAIVAAVVFRAEGLRVPTLVAAGIIAATITPPSDTSLLSIAPPVLLQVLVCTIAVGVQLFDRPDLSWWRFYGVIEPLLIAVLAAIVILPFARDGLSPAVLLAWCVPPALAAAAVGFVGEALGRRRTERV